MDLTVYTHIACVCAQIYIYIYIYVCVCVTLEHKTSLKSLGYIYSNSQKYIVWVKIIDFFLWQKSLGY